MEDKKSKPLEFKGTVNPFKYGWSMAQKSVRGKTKYYDVINHNGFLRLKPFNWL